MVLDEKGLGFLRRWDMQFPRRRDMVLEEKGLGFPRRRGYGS